MDTFHEIKTALVIMGSLIFFYLYYYGSNYLAGIFFRNSREPAEQKRGIFSRKLNGPVDKEREISSDNPNGPVDQEMGIYSGKLNEPVDKEREISSGNLNEPVNQRRGDSSHKFNEPVNQDLNISLQENEQISNNAGIYMFRKLSGFIFMGIIPGFFYLKWIDPGFSALGLNVGALKENFLIIIAISALIIFLVYLISRYYGPAPGKPQINARSWSPRLFLLSSSGWVLYLAGYEFLFRGFLLITCYNAFGIWVAIAINLVIYSAVHMVNGTGETLGALVFGFVVCLFVIYRETIIIPVVMHIVLAVSADYFAIKFNPGLKFVNKNSVKEVIS